MAAPRLREALGARLFAPDLATLRRLHDKLAFAQAAQSQGLPVPESRAVDRPSNLSAFVAESRKWVFKRRFTRFGEATLVSPDAAQL